MVAVRWYLRYGLSYRDVEELLAERRIEVDHVTVYRWVQRFTPLLALTAAADLRERVPEIAGGAVVATLATAGLLVVGRTSAAPLIPTVVLRRRSVLAGLSVMLAATATMLSMFYLGSLYLQITKDAAPLRTGLAFLPAAIVILAAAHTAAHLISAFGTRRVAVAAFLTAAAGTALLAGAVGTDRTWWVVAGLALTAAGLGPAFVAATSARCPASPPRTPDQRPASSTPATNSVERWASRR